MGSVSRTGGGSVEGGSGGGRSGEDGSGEDWDDDEGKYCSPGPSRSAPSLGNAKHLNFKFLIENIKVLAGKIKVLEETLEMKMHLENHTLDSAALLHELYNDMRKLGLE
ncbi:hypothetical protein Tco_1229594 [Tanacetum coccineum]